MTAPDCSEECRQFILTYFRTKGVDAHVTHLPPIVPPRYEPLDMICPHGVLWFAEPTTDQIMQWALDGTP